MNREEMRSTLFYLFIGVVTVTVSLVSIGTVIEFFYPQFISTRAWELVSWGWAVVFGEIVLFVISLARNLFGLGSDDLARAIANKWAQDIVKDANGDPDALTTSYQDTNYHLKIVFRNQGQNWLKTLEREFKAETLCEARRVPGLQAWKAPERMVEIEPQ